MTYSQNRTWISANNWKAAILMLLSATSVATYPLLLKLTDGEKWFLGFTAAIGAARAAGILVWGKFYLPEIHTIKNQKRFFRYAIRGDSSQTKIWNKYMWLSAVPCRITSVGFVISARWVEPAAGYLVYEVSTVLMFLWLRMKDAETSPNKTFISARMSWFMIGAIMAGIWMVKISETGKIDMNVHPAWLLIIAVGSANAFQIERSLKFGERYSTNPVFSSLDNIKSQTYWSSVFVGYASAVHALIFVIPAAIFAHYPESLDTIAVVLAVTLIAGTLSMICRRAANNRSGRLDIEGIRRLAPVISVAFIWLADKAGLVQLDIANWVWFGIGAALVVVCSVWANMAVR